MLDVSISENNFFWFFAIVGSALFVFQFLLSMSGASDHDSNGEHDLTDPGNFKWLSKQAVTGFLMMFGWVGLTCQKEFNLGSAVSAGIAFLGGLVAVIATGFIFKTAKKLHSPGHVYDLQQALGKEAMVYQQIVKGGMGKISVSIQDMMYEIDAIALNGEEFPSFTRVKIIEQVDEKTVVVTTLK